MKSGLLVLSISVGCLLLIIDRGSHALNASSGYGPYELYSENLEACKNTKKKSVALNECKISFKKNPKGTLQGNITIVDDIGPAMQTMSALIWNGKKYVPKVLTPPMNLCEFTYMRKKVFELFVKFKYTDKRCTISKGSVIFKDLDIQEMSYTMVGLTFFYGRFKVRIEYFTPQVNLLCLEYSVRIVKKINKGEKLK